MFTMIKIFGFLLFGVIAASTLFVPSLLAQNDNDMVDVNSSFSIYSNNFYSSNQDVSITLSAYNIVKRPEFTFKVYKIKDIEGFFSRQTSTYSIDVLSKDST